EKLASRVAHVHLRRMPVEIQECNKRSHHAQQDHEIDAVVFFVKHHYSQCRENDADRNRRGNAVHVVEHVQRIHDPNHPYDTQEIIQSIYIGKIDRRAGYHQDDSTCNLRAEFQEWSRVVSIISKTKKETKHRCQKYPDELFAEENLVVIEED